ncbi:MAG: hypothetical protein PW845_09250 [Pseudomonas sp.]|nr:hypothetical protein [Pseudomonas sp.]
MKGWTEYCAGKTAGSGDQLTASVRGTSTTEAVQLCERFRHAHLGIVFNGYHWYAAQEDQLELRLDAVWPWLVGVNIAGCRMSPLGWEGMGGDVYNNLRRSRDAFRAMEQRYAEHPHWALMNLPQ